MFQLTTKKLKKNYNKNYKRKLQLLKNHNYKTKTKRKSNSYKKIIALRKNA